MISSKNRSYMRATLYVLMTALILSIAGINKAQAIQAKKGDTVSTSDVQFTDIPTAADSIAARKKAAQEKEVAKTTQEVSKITNDVAKNHSGVTIVVKMPEVPKSLWQIFIEGLLGGFTALLLPCIFPMLPLTVSFFTKRQGESKKGISGALIYGLSIILIYVGLGMLIIWVEGEVCQY